MVERLPEMALRHDSGGLDDVVVRSPTMFRAEMMDEGTLWMACYFDRKHQRVTFHVSAVRKGVLAFSTGELPPEWVDIDNPPSPIDSASADRLYFGDRGPRA